MCEDGLGGKQGKSFCQHLSIKLGPTSSWSLQRRARRTAPIRGSQWLQSSHEPRRATFRSRQQWVSEAKHQCVSGLDLNRDGVSSISLSEVLNLPQMFCLVCSGRHRHRRRLLYGLFYCRVRTMTLLTPTKPGGTEMFTSSVTEFNICPRTWDVHTSTKSL